jgi:hypothetical protein
MVAHADRSAMDTYATCIGADGTPDEYIAIARFYETKSVRPALSPYSDSPLDESDIARYIPPPPVLFLRLPRPTAQENAKAGNFYRKANDFPRALRLFLQCGDAEVNSAIDVVGEARSEMLTNTLVSASACGVGSTCWPKKKISMEA